jgi:hypothetical protein
MEPTTIESLAAALSESETQILTGFAAWVVEIGEADVINPNAAAVALTFESPSHLDRRQWVEADLLPLCTEILGRFSPDEVLEILPACAAYFVHLESTDQLAEGSDDSDTLVESLSDVAGVLLGIDDDDSDDDGDDDWDGEQYGWSGAARRQGEGDGDDAEPTLIELPARTAPSPERVAAVAAEAPVMVAFAAIVDYLGAGQALAETGRFPDTDGGALDSLAESLDADRQTLDALFEWAKAAGVVRVSDGRMVTVDTWADLAARPLDALDAALAGVWKSGPLALRRGGSGAYLDEADAFLDAQMSAVLALLYARDTLPFDEAATMLEEAVSSLPSWADLLDEPEEQEYLRELVRKSLADTFDCFERAGVIVWQSTEGSNRTSDRRGGSGVVTVYGEYWCQANLHEFGFVAPVLPPFEATIDDPDDDLVVALAEQMVAGPEPLLASLEALGGQSWLMAFMPRVWRIGRVETEMVLVGIDAAHPDKSVRKAARKALMQHHSAGYHWD